MENKFYQAACDIVAKTLTDKNFERKNDGDFEYYSDSKRAFTIEYDADKKLIMLKSAVLREGEDVDFNVVSSWMLEESAEERDLISIGNDFSDTVLEQLGEKASANGISKVDLPSKNKNAETVTVDAFTARFLAIYPAYKEEYVKNVSQYGEFMYDKFFSEFGPKVVRDVLGAGNKKQIDKMFALFNSCFVIGDVSTESTIVVCILAPALLDDEKLRRDAFTYMEKYTFLKTAVENMIAMLSKPSKRKKYMIG